MKISGVVFDYGGVLTASTAPIRVRELVEARGIPWQVVLDGFPKFRLDYDRGDITLHEFYRRLWTDAGCSVSDEDSAAIEAADSASWLYRNERTLGWMRELKTKGFRLGILTNMPPTFAAVFKKHFADYIELCDALVISGEEHLVKPSPEIYGLMERRIALPAAELCFIDDNENNCTGARKCGWQALRFVSNGQVERDFEGLL